MKIISLTDNIRYWLHKIQMKHKTLIKSIFSEI